MDIKEIAVNIDADELRESDIYVLSGFLYGSKTWSGASTTAFTFSHINCQTHNIFPWHWDYEYAVRLPDLVFDNDITIYLNRHGMLHRHLQSFWL